MQFNNFPLCTISIINANFYKSIEKYITISYLAKYFLIIEIN